MPSEQNAPPTTDSFDLLFHNHPLPMWIYDLETLAFLAVNAAAVEKYGYTQDEFLAMTIKEIRPPGDVPRLLADVAQARPVLQHAGQWQHRIKDGRVIDVEITSHTLAFNGRQAALVTAQDVTARVQAEASNRKLNRIYALLSDTNQAIVRIRQPQALWEYACRIAVERGGFRMAWIGLVDEVTRKVEVAAQAGVSDGYLEKLAIVLDDDARGRGPTAAALKTGQHMIVNDLAQDPRMAPWREDALRLGYRASAAFPLQVNGQTRGAFNLYAGEADFFDAQEIKLLDELALDLSFALEFAETEEGRMRGQEALGKSEERFRRGIFGAPFPIMIHAENGEIITVNTAWTTLTGYEHRDIPTIADWTQKAYGTRKEMVRADIDQLYALDGPKEEGEYTILTRSGETRIWNFNSASIGQLPDGRRLVISMAMDVTQRKQAEKALRESERSLKEAQSIAGLGSYVLDVPAGRWTSSDVLDDLFGIDEIYERSIAGWAALIHPDDRQRMVDYFANEVLGASLHFDEEYRIIRHADKAERWVHGLGKLEIDAQNRVVTMHGTIQDITERKRAEETLHLQSAALNAAANSTVITDRDGTIEWVNPAFSALTGYTAEEAIGKNPRDLVKSGKHDLAFFKLLWDTILAGEIWRSEIINRRKDGTLYMEEQTITPVINADGEIAHFIAIKQDITVRKQLEHEAIAARDHLTNVLNSITDAFITMDREWRITFINPEAARINKKRPDEFIGRTHWEEWPASVGTIVEEQYRKAMTERVAVHFEHRYYQEGLHDVWLDIHAYPTEDGLALLYRDITEVKQVQERLAENLLLLRMAGEKARLGGWSVNLADNCVTWSDEVAAIHDMPAGHSPPVSEGISYYAPEWQEKITTVFTQCAQAGIPYDEEMEIITATGRRVWVRTMGEAVRDASGRIVKVQGAFQDISALRKAEEVLRESEAELRALFASMQDTVLVIDRTGVYRKVAPTNPAFWYIPPEELLGKRLQEVFPAEQSAVFSQAVQQVLDTQQTTQIEYELFFEGQSVWYAASISPMDADRTLWVVRDITEQKRTQDALRQRLSELEALHTVSTALRTAKTQEEALPLLLDKTLATLNTDAGAIWLYHAESDDLRVAVESGWFQRLGKPVIKSGESVGGAVFRSGQAHISAEFLSDPQARSSTRGHAPPGWGGACVPIRSGAATVGVFYVSLPPPRQISPEQLRLLESLAEMAGVTLHRLRLLQDAQAQALRIQTIIDTTPTGLLLLDADGQILLANRVARGDLAVLTAGAETGSRLERLGDRGLADLLVPPSAKEMWHTVEAGTRTFEILARPMANPPHGPSYWVLAINDVTQIREQQRYQQAQERLATVGQLAAGIAHDFNNIMGVIVLYAGSLRSSGGLSQRQLGQANTIYEQAQHATNLIRQILDFSRRSVLQRAPFNLLPLVKELIKILERTLPENIRLELANDRREYTVDGDPTRLQQALMNLALNARDAMPTGGRLTFTCATLSLAPEQAPPLPDMDSGEWLCLSVADTGTGIAPQDLDHLFEPFFTTKEQGKGTGLGLAQVHGIIKQHQGSLDVASQLGEGTVFTVYLPLLTTAMPVKSQAAAHPLTGGSEGVLVVEDNPAIRLSVVDILEELGYEMYVAGNGEEALAMLAAASPGTIKLLITDLVMPGMGGVKLAQIVRRRYPAIKILPMTGHPLGGGEEELRQIGVQTWLPKPFDISKLTANVRALLDQ